MSQICASCGARLPDDSEEKLCPRCQGLEPDPCPHCGVSYSLVIDVDEEHNERYRCGSCGSEREDCAL